MPGDNRILKIVFVVLLIAVIGELIYFFSIPNNQPQTNNSVIPTPIPRPTFAGPRDADLPPAFAYNLLNDLSLIPYYPNTKATITMENRNKVIEVNPDKVIVGNEEYAYSIKFEYQQGMERWTRLTPQEVAKMKVYIDEGGGGIKKPANLKDVKKGDTVLLKIVLNPFYISNDPRQLEEVELDIIR